MKLKKILLIILVALSTITCLFVKCPKEVNADTGYSYNLNEPLNIFTDNNNYISGTFSITGTCDYLDEGLYFDQFIIQYASGTKILRINVIPYGQTTSVNIYSGRCYSPVYSHPNSGEFDSSSIIIFDTEPTGNLLTFLNLNSSGSEDVPLTYNYIYTERDFLNWSSLTSDIDITTPYRFGSAQLPTDCSRLVIDKDDHTITAYANGDNDTLVPITLYGSSGWGSANQYHNRLAFNVEPTGELLTFLTNNQVGHFTFQTQANGFHVEYWSSTNSTHQTYTSATSIQGVAGTTYYVSYTPIQTLSSSGSYVTNNYTFPQSINPVGLSNFNRSYADYNNTMIISYDYEDVIYDIYIEVNRESLMNDSQKELYAEYVINNMSATSFIGTIATGIGSILGLKIFGNISLGVLIFIPLLLGVIALIFKLGGKD